jgi:hypothetical protein
MNLRRYLARANLLVAAVLMLAVWMLIVWVASRPAFKGLIDLTPQSVNSVDPATEDLLHELRDQKVEVEFHLFFPRTNGQAQDQAMQQEIAIRDRLRDLTRLLLVRYRYLGGELVTVKEHDMTTDLASTREAAQRFGYTDGADAVVVAVKQPGREPRFRKLVVSVDLADIQWPDMSQQNGPMAKPRVPVLKRYLGELGLSSAIKGLLVQGTPVGYVIRSYSPQVDLDNPTIGFAYGQLLRNLEQLGFELRDLSLQSTHVVPRDAAFVMVLEPRYDFSDADSVALFDYVQRGGRLFLNYSYNAQADWNPDGGKLGELLGYEIGKQVVYHLIEDVRGGGRGLDGNDAVGKLRLQLMPHPITMRLSGGVPFELAAAREIRPRGATPNGVTPRELLITGPQGWLARLGSDGRPETKAPAGGLRPFVVGMAFEVDQAAAAAPNPSNPADPKNPANPANPTDPAKGTPPASDAQKGQVVVISGVFCNNFGLPRFGDLAYNICNWMAERRVLMNIQSSKHTAQQMMLKPQQVDRVKWLLQYGVPAVFLLGGLIVVYRRRR